MVSSLKERIKETLFQKEIYAVLPREKYKMTYNKKKYEINKH